MFNCKTKIEAAKKEAQGEFHDIIKTFHEEYELKQDKIKKGFDLNSLGVISINVWDEVDEHGRTYAYVEMSGVPDVYCFEILNHLWQHLRQHDAQNVEMRFYDSTTIYPINLLRETGRYTSFKRWELLFHDVSGQSLDEIVELLKKAPLYHGLEFHIYSES